MAVFGGTFDPPHVGHLVVASEVRYRGGFDEVLLMVANDPWQKHGTREITPASVRYEMVAAAVAGNDGLVASNLEIGRGGPTYTIDTVEQLTAGPDVDVTVVLGADAVAGLDSWHRAEDLASMVSIVAVARQMLEDVWTMLRKDVVYQDANELKSLHEVKNEVVPGEAETSRVAIHSTQVEVIAPDVAG